MSDTYKRIYAAINRVPSGRAATYGQVAYLASVPGQAQWVGYTLSVLSDEQDVAWHRVVNAKGEVSSRSQPGFERIQRARLEKEGVRFGSDGRISSRRFQYMSE